MTSKSNDRIIREQASKLESAANLIEQQFATIPLNAVIKETLKKNALTNTDYFCRQVKDILLARKKNKEEKRIADIIEKLPAAPTNIDFNRLCSQMNIKFSSEHQQYLFWRKIRRRFPELKQTKRESTANTITFKNGDQELVESLMAATGLAKSKVMEIALRSFAYSGLSGQTNLFSTISQARKMKESELLHMAKMVKKQNLKGL